MSEDSGTSGEGKRRHRWAWLILSVVLFAVLMAFRGEIHAIWLRAFVAGLAFVVLFQAVRGLRHSSSPRAHQIDAPDERR